MGDASGRGGMMTALQYPTHHRTLVTRKGAIASWSDIRVALNPRVFHSFVYRPVIVLKIGLDCISEVGLFLNLSLATVGSDG